MTERRKMFRFLYRPNMPDAHYDRALWAWSARFIALVMFFAWALYRIGVSQL